MLPGVDRRRGRCYLRVPVTARRADDETAVGPCRRPLDETMTRSTCCCTVGRGWTDDVTTHDDTCTPCPRNGSRTSLTLQPPHAHSADVASGTTVARRLRVDVHDDIDNDDDSDNA